MAQRYEFSIAWIKANQDQRVRNIEIITGLSFRKVDTPYSLG